MKFYDIDISVNKDNDILISQNNIYEDKNDCVYLTKDMLIPVIKELEKIVNDYSEKK